MADCILCGSETDSDRTVFPVCGKCSAENSLDAPRLSDVEVREPRPQNRLANSREQNTGTRDSNSEGQKKDNRTRTVWAALKTGLYVVLFLRGHAIWVIIAETESSLFSNPADATTPEKRKRAQEAKDEARGVTVAASFGGGLLLIFVAVSVVAQAEAWSPSGGEVGLIWIISAPIFVIGVILVIVSIFTGAYWALSDNNPGQKDE